MRRNNLLSSIFWFLVGLGFTYGGLHYGFGAWKEPGPGLLPAVFGTLLSILSAALFVITLRSRRDAKTVRFWEMDGSWKPIASTLLSLVVFMILLKPIGFILVTFLFTFVLLRFIGKKGWLISSLIAFIFSISCYGLFGYLLGTPLPKGQIYGSSFRHLTRV